jgi:hypothetical protein
MAMNVRSCIRREVKTNATALQGFVTIQFKGTSNRQTIDVLFGGKTRAECPAINADVFSHQSSWQIKFLAWTMRPR